MTWLTWRQFRPQAITALAALAAFALVLGVTEPRLASMYASSGVATCYGQACNQPAVNFLNGVSGIYPLVFTLGVAAVILAPAVIGIFWGLRWSPASSRPEPSGWSGRRASPGPGGWPASSPCPA
jgi:hypothetical protein